MYGILKHRERQNKALRTEWVLLLIFDYVAEPVICMTMHR